MFTSTFGLLLVLAAGPCCSPEPPPPALGVAGGCVHQPWQGGGTSLAEVARSNLSRGRPLRGGPHRPRCCAIPGQRSFSGVMAGRRRLDRHERHRWFVSSAAARPGRRVALLLLSFACGDPLFGRHVESDGCRCAAPDAGLLRFELRIRGLLSNGPYRDPRVLRRRPRRCRTTLRPVRAGLGGMGPARTGHMQAAVAGLPPEPEPGLGSLPAALRWDPGAAAKNVAENEANACRGSRGPPTRILSHRGGLKTEKSAPSSREPDPRNGFHVCYRRCASQQNGPPRRVAHSVSNPRSGSGTVQILDSL